MSDKVEILSAEKSKEEKKSELLTIQNDSLKNEILKLQDALSSVKEAKQASEAEFGEEIAESESLSRSAIYSKSAKTEYDKKAIFLYNFISYIEWPEDNNLSTFNIGVVGESQIRRTLTSYVAGKTVNKKPIVVEGYKAGKTYQILFFAENGILLFKDIKKKMINQPVLFVSENQNLEKKGCHITLNVDGSKISFTANKQALQNSKLKISNSFYSLSQ